MRRIWEDTMRRNLVLLTAFCALTSFAAHADDQRRENLYTVTALTSNLPNVAPNQDGPAKRLGRDVYARREPFLDFRQRYRVLNPI